MNEIKYIDFKTAETLFESRKTVVHTSNFIYFVVFWTALNSVLNFIPNNPLKIFGLTLDMCLMIDTLITNAPTLMIIIGLIINLLVILFFIYLARKITKRELWAYKLALMLYSLDSILIFVMQFEGKIGIFIIHLFVILLMWSEMNDYKDYFKLEKNLYLPDWALTEQSYVLFIRKEDFDLQPDAASQIIFYKKAVHCQEENKPVTAIEYYTKAINIWTNIPNIKNKDKDWFALALMNRAILELSIRSRNNQEVLQDLIRAYANFKIVIKEEVKKQKGLKKSKFLNYEFVSEYYAQCSYYLLLQMTNNDFIDSSLILRYCDIFLSIKANNINSLISKIYKDCHTIFTTYNLNLSENVWALKIQNEL